MAQSRYRAPVLTSREFDERNRANTLDPDDAFVPALHIKPADVADETTGEARRYSLVGAFGNATSAVPSYVVERELPFATPAELLAFANTVRLAGGGELIPELLPSTPADSEQCLVANALNFECTVESFNGPDGSETHERGGYYWYLVLSDPVVADRIARAIGAAMVHNPLTLEPPRVQLPEKIGNCAELFDAGLAFGEWVED